MPGAQGKTCKLTKNKLTRNKQTRNKQARSQFRICSTNRKHTALHTRDASALRAWRSVLKPRCLLLPCLHRQAQPEKVITMNNLSSTVALLSLCLSACASGSTKPVTQPTPTNPGKLSYAIVDTGQVTCYDSTTGAPTACVRAGHDADHTGRAPSYTTSADGSTVTDNVTGLTWTQSTDIDGSGRVDYADKRSPAAANSYCEALNQGGYTDWRLPSLKESYSLILFSGRDPSSDRGTDTSTLKPFIDPSFDFAFGDTTTAAGIAAGDRLIDAQYASTTNYVFTTMLGDATMFGVNFIDGRIKGYPSARKLFYVRCVRGNAAYGQNRLVDNGNQTVSDAATGLMWQKDDARSNDWPDAVSRCESATTASHTDWRLPNVKELQSIVDYTRSPDTTASAAIDTSVFNATSFTNEEGVLDWGDYWSSTTHVDDGGNGSNAAYVSFGRSLGYFAPPGTTARQILDVHGAGAQRSNDKVDVSTEPGAKLANEAFGNFYYKGPQGDILRLNNQVRCVRSLD